MPTNMHRAGLSLPMQMYLKRQDHLPMESVDWKLVRAAQVPGPGQHDAHIRTGTLNDRLSTGGWSGHTGKVFHSEHACKTAEKLPGPGEYQVKQGLLTEERVRGASLDKAANKTMVDGIIKRSRKLPAPNAYELPAANPMPEGGRISTSITKNVLESVIKRAGMGPGPNEYMLPELKPRPGGKFSLANPKSEVDWQIERAKKQPGPNEYHLKDSRDHIGGQMSRVDRVFENVKVMKRGKNRPGPADYDPLESWKFAKSQGQSGGCSISGRTGPSFLPYPYEACAWSRVPENNSTATLKEKRFGNNAKIPPVRSNTSLGFATTTEAGPGKRTHSTSPTRKDAKTFLTQTT